MREKTEKDVIAAFVAHLGHAGLGSLTVDRWPDEETRSREDIDAIAGNFAIEHTSVDALDQRRWRDDQWLQAVGGLEAELNGAITAHLSIATGYRAVTKGQVWLGIREAIGSWVRNEAETLGVGRHEVKIHGVPFRLIVWKGTDLSPGVHFSRMAADEDETLAISLGPLIERKAKKLARYRHAGKSTLLLLENNDIAMMNHIKLHDAITEAFPQGWPHGVEQIWYVDTKLWPAAQFFDMRWVAKECGA